MILTQNLSHGEETPARQLPEEKIYTDRHIWFSAFLGSPLAAGYLIAANYKVFGKPQKAIIVRVITIIIHLAFIGILLAIPGAENGPATLIPIGYALLTAFWVQYYQAAHIRAHIEASGPTYKPGRVIIISVIGCLASVVLCITAKALAYNDKYSLAITRYYGRIRNEILFEEGNIPEVEADRVAETLIVSGYFNQQQRKRVYVHKQGNIYELSLLYNIAPPKSQQASASFSMWRNEFQKNFPGDSIILHIVAGSDIDHPIERFE